MMVDLHLAQVLNVYKDKSPLYLARKITEFKKKKKTHTQQQRITHNVFNLFCASHQILVIFGTAPYQNLFSNIFQEDYLVPSSLKALGLTTFSSNDLFLLKGTPSFSDQFCPFVSSKWRRILAGIKENKAFLIF